MRAPQFTKKLSDLTINDGEQLELNVNVDGDPEPQVTWSKNGKASTYMYTYKKNWRTYRDPQILIFKFHKIQYFYNAL